MKLILEVLGMVLLGWLALAAVLLIARPRGGRLADFMRLLPDTLRLFRALLQDPAVPISAKAWVWFLLGYIAMPLDLVPDFIPVLGYADDAILAAIVLRTVLRRAGRNKISEHWRGTPDGLAVLLRAANAR